MTAAEKFRERVADGMEPDKAFIIGVAVTAGWKISPRSIVHMAELQDLLRAYAEVTGLEGIISPAMREEDAKGER